MVSDAVPRLFCPVILGSLLIGVKPMTETQIVGGAIGAPDKAPIQNKPTSRAVVLAKYNDRRFNRLQRHGLQSRRLWSFAIRSGRDWGCTASFTFHNKPRGWTAAPFPGC